MKRLCAIAVTVALTAVACGNKDTGTTTAPTVTQKTDNFSGTVQVNGSAIHNFTVENSGQVSVTLTTASPPSDVVLGIGVGTPGDNACGLLSGASVNARAGSTAQLTGVVSPGMLCVKIFDVGSQTAAVAYTVTVMHP
jgi:hypothetical protein